MEWMIINYFWWYFIVTLTEDRMYINSPIIITDFSY